MTETVHEFDTEALRRLNSATQYPSIPTYHVLGERGRLTEALNEDFSDEHPENVEVTEKIDGTNTRLIVPPLGVGNVLVGSRTELLHHRGDVIANPAQDIVPTVADWLLDAEAVRAADPDGEWVVLFGEVYGGKVSSGSKNYTTNKDRRGFRLFDVASFSSEVLSWPRDDIARWRDHMGQEFVRSDVLAQVADDLGFDLVPLLEYVSSPPASVADTHDWLRNAIVTTHAALDDSAQTRPEGVVVRTADRRQIAKVRFEDYERTAKPVRRS